MRNTLEEPESIFGFLSGHLGARVYPGAAVCAASVAGVFTVNQNDRLLFAKFQPAPVPVDSMIISQYFLPVNKPEV